MDPDNKPARACVEAPMAKPGILFEAQIVAKRRPAPKSPLDKWGPTAGLLLAGCCLGLLLGRK